MKQKRSVVKCITAFVLTLAMVLGTVQLPFIPGNISAHADAEHFSWLGGEGFARVETGLGNDTETYGQWYVKDDHADGGKSYVIFDKASPDGDPSIVTDDDVNKYYGVSGTAYLGKGELTSDPYVYICFDIVGATSEENPEPLPYDVSGWEGLAISYWCDCDSSLELGLGDITNASMQYALPYVSLPKTKTDSCVVKYFTWDNFKQPSRYKGSNKISGTDAAKQLVTVMFKIQAVPGTYYFWINGIGSYDAALPYLTKPTIYADKDSIEPTVTIADWVYGDTPSTPSVIGNTGNGDVTYTYSSDGVNFIEGVPTQAGNYIVKATIEETEDYLSAETTADFTISKKTVDSEDVKIYRGGYYKYTGEQVTVPKEDLTVKIGNDIIGSDEYDISYGENIKAGSYGTFTLKSNDKCNYIFEKTDTFVINYLVLDNLAVSLEDWTYGDTPNEPVVTGNLGGGKVTYSYVCGKYIVSDEPDSREKYQGLPSDAGDYVLYVSVEQTENYYGDGTHCEFTIKKAPVTITADNKKKVYGEDDPELTATITGNPAVIDEVQYDIYRESGEDVGTYTIEVYEPGVAPGMDRPNPNFDVTYVNGTLTITKAAENAINITLDGWTYGEAANVPTISAAFGADTVSYSYSNAENGTYTPDVPTNAGTYWVKASIPGTDNYVAGEAKKSFVIAKKNVSIEGLSVSGKTYDGTVNAVVTGNATVSGVLGSDDVSVVSGTASFADKNVGTAKAVTFSGFSLKGTDAGNYNLSAQPASTTADITAKAVTVKADDISKVYGETDPAKTVTITGLADGESESQITYTVSRVTGENAGTYTITPAGEAVQGNYTVSFVTGTLTVSQAQSIANAPGAAMSVNYAEGNVVYDQVSKIALPDGWAWLANNQDKTLAVGTPVTATAIYNGTDKDNYTDSAKSVSITITRAACTHENCETEIKDAVTATCTEAGYTGDTYCKTCGEKISSGDVINATGHNLTAHEAHEASYTEAGNSAYWSCDKCGKYFSDAEGKNEIAEGAWVIDKLDPVTTPDPTTTPSPGNSGGSTTGGNGGNTTGGNGGNTPATSPSPTPVVTETKNKDGSVTKSSVQENSDGTTTTTEKTSYKDGSSVETETTTTKNGFTKTEKTTAADGSVQVVTSSYEKTSTGSRTQTVTKTEESTVTENTVTDSKGTTKETITETRDSKVTETVTTAKDGSTSNVKKTETPEGTVTETVTQTKKGTITKETVTETADSKVTERKTVSYKGKVTETVITETADSKVLETVTTTKKSTTKVTETVTAIGTTIENVNVSKKGTKTVTSETIGTDGDSLSVSGTIKKSGKISLDATAESSDGTVQKSSFKNDKNAASEGKDGSGEAIQGIKLTSIDTDSKTATIPSEITGGGETFAVTTIGEGALAGNENLESVEIGTNVTTIEAGAFAGDTNLKTITISSANIISIAKDAFDGIPEDAEFVLVMTKKQYKALKKLLKKLGLPKTVKFRRVSPKKAKSAKKAYSAKSDKKK